MLIDRSFNDKMNFSSTPAYDRTNLWALSITLSLVMIGFGFFSTFIPIYAELLGTDIGIQIGVIVAAYTVTRALTCTPSGWLSDKFGRKNILCIGVFCYALVTLIISFSGDWIQLLILRGLQGITSAMIWISATAMIVDSTPSEKRGRAPLSFPLQGHLG